jgi:hypothetical protein
MGQPAIITRELPLNNRGEMPVNRDMTKGHPQLGHCLQRVPMPIQHPHNQQRMRNPNVRHKLPRHRHPLELLLAANKNASFSYIMERKLPFSLIPLGGNNHTYLGFIKVQEKSKKI